MKILRLLAPTRQIYASTTLENYLPNWIINERVNSGGPPDVYDTLGEETKLSAFEESMTELLKDGLVTCEYVQDVFQQEQVFIDNFERIKKEFPGKDIAVCGGEIFVGDTSEEVEKKAHDKYKNRPAYSYTPNVEL